MSRCWRDWVVLYIFGGMFVCLFLLYLVGWHGSSISQGGRDKGHLFQLWEDLIPFSFWNTSVARDSICPWKRVWFGPPVAVPRCTGKKTNDTWSRKWTVLRSMWQHMQLFLWQPGEARFKLPFYYVMHQLSPGPKVVGALLHVFLLPSNLGKRNTSMQPTSRAIIDLSTIIINVLWTVGHCG